VTRNDLLIQKRFDGPPVPVLLFGLGILFPRYLTLGDRPSGEETVLALGGLRDRDTARMYNTGHGRRAKTEAGKKLSHARSQTDLI
jgi:hypothetical protein